MFDVVYNWHSGNLRSPIRPSPACAASAPWVPRSTGTSNPVRSCFCCSDKSFRSLPAMGFSEVVILVIFTTSRGWLNAESTTYGVLLALATRGIHNLAMYRTARLPGLQVLAIHGDYTMCE